MATNPDDLLDKATTEKILETEVFNSTGEKIKLGSVFEENQKTILVFIREFMVLLTFPPLF